MWEWLKTENMSSRKVRAYCWLFIRCYAIANSEINFYECWRVDVDSFSLPAVDIYESWLVVVDFLPSVDFYDYYPDRCWLILLPTVDFYDYYPADSFFLPTVEWFYLYSQNQHYQLLKWHNTNIPPGTVYNSFL